MRKVTVKEFILVETKKRIFRSIFAESFYVHIPTNCISLFLYAFRYLNHVAKWKMNEKIRPFCCSILWIWKPFFAPYKNKYFFILYVSFSLIFLDKFLIRDIETFFFVAMLKECAFISNVDRELCTYIL